jgi:aldehyde dehydrogenase (NAD+)
MADQLKSGTVWVNTYRAVSFMAPFGGYKDSGLGRENGIDAVQEYLQTKCVWINSGAVTANPFVLK